MSLFWTLPDLKWLEDDRIKVEEGAVKISLNPAYGQGTTDYVSLILETSAQLGIGITSSVGKVALIVLLSSRRDQVHTGVLLYGIDIACTKYTDRFAGMFMVRSTRQIDVWLLRANPLAMAKDLMNQYTSTPKYTNKVMHTDLGRLPSSKILQDFRNLVNADLDQPYKLVVGKGKGKGKACADEGSNCVMFAFRLLRKFGWYDADLILSGLDLPNQVVQRLSKEAHAVGTSKTIEDFKRKWNEQWAKNKEHEFVNPWKRRCLLEPLTKNINDYDGSSEHSISFSLR